MPNSGPLITNDRFRLKQVTVHVSHTSSSILLRSLSRIASSTFFRFLWSSRTSNMRQSTTARSATINSTPITSLMPTIVRILPPSSKHHPCYTCNLIINLPLMPGVSNQVSQFLINQQGFYVDFREHGLRMACL